MIHDIITHDANSVSWAEIWELSKLQRDIIDAVIITKIIVFEYRQTSNISCTLDNKLVNHSHVVIILQQTLNFFYNRQMWHQVILQTESETESWFP